MTYANYDSVPVSATQLRETIGKFAERYDFCSEGVVEFCNEIGIDPPVKDFIVTVEVEYSLSAIDESTAEELIDDVFGSWDGDLGMADTEVTMNTAAVKRVDEA